MTPRPVLAAVALTAAAGLAATACGTDLGDAGSSDHDELPSIVASTSILGDVVTNMVGELATVEVIIGPGTDPHDFQASAQQADAMREADVLVTNGADLEEGLIDTIDAAASDGIEVCEAIDGVETLSTGTEDDEDGHDDHDHHHSGVDPHFFTDPARMADAVDGLTDCIAAAVRELDTAEFREQSADYADQLIELDEEVEEQLADIADDERVLITNHDVFEYLADRYEFEVAGAIVASSSTQTEADAQELAELAELIEDTGVPVVFADSSSPDRLAGTLADEADVEVVTLFTESLGPDGADTYIELVTTNAERISEALG